MKRRIGRTIIAVEVGDVSRIMAWIYGTAGCVSALSQIALMKTESITFPVGFILPFLHFAFNLNLPRPEHPFTGVLSVFGIIAAFTVSGVITGTLLGWGFNLAADHTGGIETKLFVFEPDEPAEPVAAAPVSLL